MMRRLFVGGLSRNTRVEDVEQVFESYGKLDKCEIKLGNEHAFAFIDFDDDRDAEDAMHGENGRKLNGERMQVEWSKPRGEKGPPRGGRGGGFRGGYGGGDFRGGDFRGSRGGYGGFRGGGRGGMMESRECYSCGRTGHISRDCRAGGKTRGGFRRDSRSRSPRRRSYSRSLSPRRDSPPPRRRDSRSPPPRRRDSRSPPPRRGGRSPPRHISRSPPPKRDRSWSPIDKRGSRDRGASGGGNKRSRSPNARSNRRSRTRSGS